MSCFLCLSPLTELVIRILECPDHWVHRNCYKPPLNPAAIRCQVCLKQGTGFANAFMYDQKPFLHGEKVEESEGEDKSVNAQMLKEETLIDKPEEHPSPESREAVNMVAQGVVQPFNLVPSVVPISSPRVAPPDKNVVSIRHHGTLVIENWDNEDGDHYFSCVVCEKRYARKFSLKKHIQRFHIQTDINERRGAIISSLAMIEGGLDFHADDNFQKGDIPLTQNLPHAALMPVTTLTAPTPVVPPKKVQSWVKAVELFSLKRKGPSIGRYNKVCVICDPPKLVLTGVGSQVLRGLYRDHLVEHHLEENGIISCPHCPSNASSIGGVYGLISHIWSKHFPQEEPEVDADEEGTLHSSTFQPNSKMPGSATMKKSRKGTEEISRSLPR